MCQICSAFRPFDSNCAYSKFDSSGQNTVETETNSISETVAQSSDQIASYLTDGYWSDNSGSRRTFNVSPGDTLTVDINNLTEPGKALARAALQSWTDVSGIEFRFVAPPQPLPEIRETDDLAADLSTKLVMPVGATVVGLLNEGRGDREDWVGIDLVAGQTYTFALNGQSLRDPYLRLYDGSGRLITYNDDGGSGLNSLITYTATTSGRHYLGAGFYDYASSLEIGTYELSATLGNGTSADISFDDNQSGAYSFSILNGSSIVSSHINIDTSWHGGDTSMDGYTFQTYLHEIGHALGLGHAGDYNGRATYGVDNTFVYDSWQTSVMSYFSQLENTSVSASRAYVMTPMSADILAIQSLYGTNVRSHHGDTIYGANSNAGGHLGDVFGQISGEDPRSSAYRQNPVTLTIFDTGGTDLIDLSFYSGNQRLNLNADTYSDAWGLTENLAIMRGVVIENGTTGDGDDMLIGNSIANNLNGRAGHDTILGGGGDDTIHAGRGNDSVLAGRGDDNLGGWYGDDTIRGEAGNDTIRGGGGQDLVYGGQGNDSISASYKSDIVYGGSGRDTIKAGYGHDTVSSEDGNDSVEGENGNDEIWSGAGNDTVLGGKGNDLVGLSFDADLARAGDGNDTVWAGAGNDTLEGNTGHDSLNGGAGADLLSGGAGNDTLRGGGGEDVFVFGPGHDVVLDFNVGGAKDRIDLSSAAGVTDYSDLLANHLTTGANGALITDADGNTLSLHQVWLGGLDTSHFIF